MRSCCWRCATAAAPCRRRFMPIRNPTPRGPSAPRVSRLPPPSPPSWARHLTPSFSKPQVKSAGDIEPELLVACCGALLSLVIPEERERVRWPSRSPSRLTSVHPPRWTKAAAAPHPPLFLPTHHFSARGAPPHPPTGLSRPPYPLPPPPPPPPHNRGVRLTPVLFTAWGQDRAPQTLRGAPHQRALHQGSHSSLITS